jgi:hypothetical protein
MTDRSPAAAPGEQINKEVCDGKGKEAKRQDGHAGDDGRVQEAWNSGHPPQGAGDGTLRPSLGWNPISPPWKPRAPANRKCSLADASCSRSLPVT